MILTALPILLQIKFNQKGREHRSLNHDGKNIHSYGDFNLILGRTTFPLRTLMYERAILFIVIGGIHQFIC